MGTCEPTLHHIKHIIRQDKFQFGSPALALDSCVFRLQFVRIWHNSVELVNLGA